MTEPGEPAADLDDPNLERTVEGMRAVVELLHALHTDDVPAAQDIVNDCDYAPTLFCFGTLVLLLVEQVSESVPALLDTLRAQIPGTAATGVAR